MRVGRVELILREAKRPADDETESPSPNQSPNRLQRIRRVARRRGLPALAVVTLIGLPGTVAATQMAMDHGEEQQAAADEGGGATVLEPEDAEFVEANWQRAMDIEPIYDDGLDLEDEEMQPLAGALGANGIPEVALDAYYNAEDTLSLDDPECGVPWSLVAAIGRVESNHGQFGGAQLLEDGYGTKPIRGIPLDGRPGVALIRDTDDGALDDDPVYDRAVGPMQFIPSSWPGVASDGNADSQKDPDNIYDASIGTGVYLCGGEGDLLEDPDARYDAVFRYNHSDEYVRTVLSLAEMYDEGGAEELPFEEPSFEDGFDDGFGDGFDADAAAAEQLGPELPEPAPGPSRPAPAPAPAPPAPGSPQPAPAPGSSGPDPAPAPGSSGPDPAPAPDPSQPAPGSPQPAPAPGSRPTPVPPPGSGPAPVPPADVPTLPTAPVDPPSVGWPQGMNELPPAELPPPPTPPTTAAPTTVPEDSGVPVDPECPVPPAPEDDPTLAGEDPAVATESPDPGEASDSADRTDPGCEPSADAPPTDGADGNGTDGASAEGAAAGSLPSPSDEPSAP